LKNTHDETFAEVLAGLETARTHEEQD